MVVWVGAGVIFVWCCVDVVYTMHSFSLLLTVLEEIQWCLICKRCRKLELDEGKNVAVGGKNYTVNTKDK